MSLSCWRAIGSHDINRSLTTLKSFDGCGFKPYGILNTFPVELEGKTMSIDIEVVDLRWIIIFSFTIVGSMPCL